MMPMTTSGIKIQGCFCLYTPTNWVCSLTALVRVTGFDHLLIYIAILIYIFFILKYKYKGIEYHSRMSQNRSKL